MPRLMTSELAKEFIYFATMIGLAVALTHVFYIYVNGAV